MAIGQLQVGRGGPLFQAWPTGPLDVPGGMDPSWMSLLRGPLRSQSLLRSPLLTTPAPLTVPRSFSRVTGGVADRLALPGSIPHGVRTAADLLRDPFEAERWTPTAWPTFDQDLRPSIRRITTGGDEGAGVLPWLQAGSGAATLAELAGVGPSRAIAALTGIPVGVTAAEAAAANAAAGVMGPGGAAGTSLLPELIPGVGAGTLALAPLAFNAATGQTGEGVALQNVGAMLSAALALSGVGLPAAIPLVLATALGLTMDEDKPSAASRHEAEGFSSQRALRDQLLTAQTPTDIAAAFSQVAGRRNPDLSLEGIEQELQGAQFDPSLGGGEYNLNTREFLRALIRANPSNEQAYADLFGRVAPWAFNQSRAPSGGDELTALNAARVLQGLPPLQPDEWFTLPGSEVLQRLAAAPVAPDSTLRQWDDWNANALLAGGGAML